MTEKAVSPSQRPRWPRRVARVLAGGAFLVLVTGAAAWSYGTRHLHDFALYSADSAAPDRVTSLVQRVEAVRLLRAVGARLRQQARTDEEFVELVTEWTHLAVRPQFASPPDLVGDNMLGLLVRGRGFCDQSASVAATVLWTQGFPVRLLGLVRQDGSSPHTVVEVEVAGKWVVVDPLYGVVMRRNGKLVSADEIDDAVVAHYGIKDVAAGDYGRGNAWRVFPFLTPRDVVARLRGARNSTAEVMKTYQQTPWAVKARHVKRTPPTDEFRRGYLQARLADLRGEVAAPRYARLEGQTTDADLLGSLRFFSALERAESGRGTIPAGEGAWATSFEGIAGLVNSDTTAFRSHLNREALVRRVLERSPSTLKRRERRALGG